MSLQLNLRTASHAIQVNLTQSTSCVLPFENSKQVRPHLLCSQWSSVVPTVFSNSICIRAAFKNFAALHSAARSNHRA